MLGTRTGRSVHPAISADGCTVAVVTELAFDLFRDDDHGERWDVYRRVLPGCPEAFEPGEWELVSTTSGRSPAASDAASADDTPALSASGSVIAYSRSSAALTGSSASWSVIEVVDLTVPIGDPGRRGSVPGLPSVAPTGPASYIGQAQPAISADGRYLAYTTDAIPTVTVVEPPTSLIAGQDPELSTMRIESSWTEAIVDRVAVTQVLRWDRMPNDDEDDELFVVVSASAAGPGGNGSSSAPAIDGRGEVIAFQSTATDLLPLAPTATPLPIGVSQVYRRDFGPTTRPTTLVSQRDGVAGEAPSSAPALDAAGRSVAFVTRAAALVLPAAVQVADPTAGDVLLADAVQGTLRRVTTRPDGQPSAMGARHPRLAATGRVVVFETIAAAEFVAVGDLPGNVPDPSVDRSGESAGGWLGVVDYPADVSSSALDLGTVEVGGTSPEWYTTIVNHGQGAFVPASIRTTSPEFAISGGSCTAGAPIMPGASCTVEVTFAPSVAGPAASDIVLAERGFAAVEVRVDVAANGGTPTLTVAPSANQLGEAIVGLDGRSATITFGNVGSVAGAIDSVVLGGSHPDDFQVLEDRCTGVVLGVGETCAVTVTLHPSESGARSATLTATAADGATASAVVVGTGRFTPVAGVTVSSVVVGGKVTVVGLGFPANSYLSIAWDGIDDPVIVLTDGRGELTVSRRVDASLGAGHRRLTVVDPLGRFFPVATDPVLVNLRVNPGASSPAHRSG